MVSHERSKEIGAELAERLGEIMVMRREGQEFIPIPEGGIIIGYTLDDLDSDAVWYHGTSADEFDEFQGSSHMRGGISFTRDYDLAEAYSTRQGGAFADFTSEYGGDRGRVIAVQLKFPPETTHVPRFEVDTHEWVSVNARGDGDEMIALWERVHDDATRIALEQGFPAYSVAHLTPGAHDELVVLDPNRHVYIVSQDATDKLSPSIQPRGPFRLTESEVENARRELRSDGTTAPNPSHHNPADARRAGRRNRGRGDVYR